MATPSKTAKIGKYDVIETIGRGGMGVVYLAKDPDLDRLVAIKMMNIDVYESGDFLKRFDLEAKRTASLQHPNIVIVYDYGKHQGQPFLVMPYLEGSSLEVLLRTHRPMGLLEKLNIIIEVCQGLGYAHQRGIVHRDIKPANIMVLNDGSVKIVDFGIARLGDHSLTRSGQIVGSLYYMPPEQIQQKGTDTRADIYSTGVVLYQLLTYSLPFEGDSTGSTLAKIISDDPPAFAHFGVSCPPELEAIALKALAKDRGQRYQSAEAFAAALAEVQHQLKQEAISEYLTKAELLQQNDELVEAQEYLTKILKLDRQHTTAARMLSTVRAKLDAQLSAERVRQLKQQAEDAYQREDFDVSLVFINQAIDFDGSAELQKLKTNIEKAKADAEIVQRAIMRAEAAQRSGDLDNAKSAIEAALSIRPDDSKIKALGRAIARDLEERERQKKLETLLDEARRQMSARKFTAALNLLKEAQCLDPSAPQLRVLLERLASEHQQEKHRRELDQLNREVQQFIDRDDYKGASAKAAEALQKFPNEPGLRRLKELADTQIALAAEREFVRNEIAAAEQALDSGQTQKALVLVESALQKAPGNSRLESFRTMLRERLAKDLSEADKATCLQQANEAFGLGRYADAIRILESAQLRFAESPDIDELLRFIRDQQTKQERQAFIDEVVRDAHRLLAEQRFDEAVQLLERAAADVPNEDLDILLRQARGQREIFCRELKAAIAKGKALLAQGAAVSAVEFLSSRPASYRQSPEFHDLQMRARSAAADSRHHEAGAAAATQLLNGAPSGPTKNTAEAEVDAATKLFAAPMSASVESMGHRVDVEWTETEPQAKFSGTKLPPAQRRWMLFGVLALVMALGISIMVWWFRRPAYLTVRAPLGSQVMLNRSSPVTVESPNGASLRVSPGNHEVEVQESGYQQWSQNINLHRGERRVLTPELQEIKSPVSLTPPPAETVAVVITCNVEGADVYVDNRYEATLENVRKTSIGITEGPHDVVLKKQGYEYSAQHVNVSKGRREKPLAFNLAKSKEEANPMAPTDAYLRIVARPGASVYVNETAREIDPRGIASLKLDPKRYEIRVDLDGYVGWSTTIDLKAGDKKTVTAKFTPKPTPSTVTNVPATPTTASSPARPSSLPKVLLFKVQPESIQAGDPTKLVWETENAKDVIIDHDIGKVPAIGERPIQPHDTSVYTLTAIGDSGETVSQVAKVVVNTPPPPPPAAKTEPKVEPATGEAGDSFRGSSADIAGIKESLNQFIDAYNLKDLDGIKRVWPRIDKNAQDAYKNLFKRAEAVNVKEQCSPVDQPTKFLPPDTAEWNCEETKAYTENKTPHPQGHLNVKWRFKKLNGKWVIEGR